MSKFTKRLLLLAMMLVPMLAMSQVMVSQYAMESGTDATKWVTLPESGTIDLITNGGNTTTSDLVNIGFDFMFGGVSYSQFSVNADGNLKFGTPATDASGYSIPFGSNNVAANTPKINGFGCNGSMGGGGYAKYAVIGEAPNRKLVVEFNVAEYSFWSSASADIKWQVQLLEGSNEIMLVYAPEAPEEAPEEFQIGMAASATDVLTINTSLGVASTGVTDIEQTRWPAANTYYRFYQPSCLRPIGLAITSMEGDEVNFSWTASAGQNAWQYTCVTRGATVDWTLAETVQDPTGSVAGLESNTVYELYVRTDCGDDDFSDAAMLVFRTGCAPMNIPYHEDFESYEEYEVPDCWTSHSGESVVGTYYPHLGEASLEVGSFDTIVAPKIKLPLNQTSLSAWIMADYVAEAGSLIVGYASDVTATDFVPVRTIVPLSDEEYQEYTIDFSTIDIEDTMYIVFIHTANDPDCWGGFYIDDISVERASACPKPGFAYIRNIDYDAATVVWEPNDNMMGFEVAYGVTDTLDNATRVIVEMGEDSLRLEGLTANTTYHVWVRNIGDVDSSMWFVVEPFNTMNSCATVKNLQVASIGTSSASVSWAIDASYGEDATAVEFSYKRFIDEVWSTPVVLTNQNYYILQNLEEGYTYEVRVKTQCGMDTSNCATIMFTTQTCGNDVVGNDGTTNKFPFSGLYYYCYSEMLYPSTELIGMDTIRGIAVHVDDVESSQTRLVDVYLQNTSVTSLSQAHQLDKSLMTKVATNVTVAIDEGWVSMMFDSLFVYDGTSNLGVMIYDHTGNDGDHVYVSTNNLGNTLYRRKDYAIYTEGSSSVSGLELLAKMPNMRFISKCPTTNCSAPIIAFENITENSVTINWTSSASETQWFVGYRESGAEDWISETVAVTNHTFDNLQLGTRYDIRVGYICEGDTIYTNVEVMTDCGEFDLPIIENFNDAMLECWTMGTTGEGEISWRSEEDNGMMDYGYSGGGYLITPIINATMNELQVSFNVSSSDIYSDGALIVSVGEDPNMLSSFVPVDTVIVSMGAPMTAQMISLANYMGSGHYIMFSSATGYLYLDEINIDETSECSMPTDLVANNITDDGATITWIDRGHAVEKWLVSYCKVRENTPIVYEVAYEDGATHTITGLDANTEYRVSVATVCTTGDTSETLYPITFWTSCAAVTLPYFEGFEDIVAGQFHNCWYRDVPVATNNSQVRFDRISVPSVFMMSEENNSAVILSSNKAIVSPMIPIPANQISVNLDMKVQDNTYSGDLIVGFTTNPDNYSAMIAVDTLEGFGNNWNNYTVDFNSLGISDTGYVVFKNTDNRYSGEGYSQTYYYIWLDNINFSEYSSCTRPTNGSISNITATSAEITFNDAGNTNNYTIAWNTEMRLEGATTLDVTTTTAQLTNLQSGTQYHVWVRSNCGESNHSSWILIGTFRTECAAMELPYIEDFDDYFYGISSDDTRPDSYPNHTLPNCWKVYGMNRNGANPVAMISSYSEFAESGNALYVDASRTKKIFMVLPVFDTEIDSLMLSFDYRMNTIHDVADELILGVLTDPTDTSTFIALEEIPSVSGMTAKDHLFVYDEDLTADTPYYIAFRFGGVGTDQSLGLDNVKVEMMPACVHPVELTASHIMMNLVEATWRGRSTNYQVQYRLVDANDWTTVNTTTESVTISNLIASGDYEMRVRGICGVGDTSSWSDVVEFTTLCAPVAVPWSENFDSYTTDVSGDAYRPETYPNHFMPECWIFAPMSSVYNGSPAAWLTTEPNGHRANYNVIEGVSLRMYGDRENRMYAVLPTMDAPIDTLVLRFDYAKASYAAVLNVGVMTDPNDYGTFQPLIRCIESDSIVSVEHYFMFDDLNPNETYYIVFDAGKSNKGITTIDNIVVDYVPSCICPGEVQNYATSHNQTGVRWMTTATSSEVMYRNLVDSVWVDTIVNADTVVLRNLMSSTDYELTVRSICGGGDSSAWSDTLRFTTECEPYLLPFNENFANITSMNDLDCWSFYRGNVDEVLAGTKTWKHLTPANAKWKHNMATDMSDLNAYIQLCDRECYEWMVTPQLSITSNSMLSFRVAFMDYSEPAVAYDFDDDRFYVMATTDNGETWTKLITWGAGVEDDYPMDSLNVISDSVSTSLNQFDGQTIRIAFYAESSVYDGCNKLFIGDVMVDGSPCAMPTDVTITPEAVTATLTWNGDGQDYEVAIRENESTVWSEPIAVNGLSYTFTGLMPNRVYVYHVRKVCADDLYSGWVEDVFTTLDLPCGKPIVSVSNVTGEGATITWDEGENHTSWEVNVFNTMMNTTIDVTTPNYEVEDLDPATVYHVAVRAKCAENVYSDWSDTIEFTTVDCLPVTNVVANEITENSAVITWTAGGEESEWLVNYGESGFAQGEGILESVTTTTYMITGLDAETDYDVYVRAVCGENFTSTWSEPVCQFQTLVAGSEGIDGIDGNFQFAIYPNPTSGMTTISLKGVEGEVTISIVDMNGRTIANESMECGSECEKRLDVAGLSQGTYFVRVIGDNVNSVRKLIVR